MIKPKLNSKIFPLLKGLKDLMGVGMYLLLAGILIEVLTVVVLHWVSFPISIAVRMQIALTFPCVLLCLLGMVWFNNSLNLARIHLLGGENKLVTEGPFNFVRHPLYATLLITLPPLMIIWYADMLLIIPWIVIFVIAHYLVLLEEQRLVKTFGENYKRYREYVPTLLPYKGAGGRRYREHSDIDLRGSDRETPRKSHSEKRRNSGHITSRVMRDR
jgi:protein-S-isoprenylcysteine O-methyltransferase Ste14